MASDDSQPVTSRPGEEAPSILRPVIPAERMIAILRYRGMDGEALLVAQHKSLKAMVEASSIVAKGMEEIASRHTSMLQNAVSRAAGVLPEMAKQRTLDDVARNNLDYSRETMAATLSNFQEMAELVWKCNRDAFELVNRSLLESLQSFAKALPAKDGDGN
ncbi:MAG TPA: phasin family protein [Candidatus Sulfotelmatobacter sp.]|nr:phasin family protein [Candidatus Sulfotelmatobacter sp.]